MTRFAMPLLSHRRQSSPLDILTSGTPAALIAYPATAAAGAAGAAAGCKTVIDDLWYRNGVIYCLSVRTYMDSDGDGIGDFKGLQRRLDYLHGLGITAIWLMPFQTSPHKDDGYDLPDEATISSDFTIANSLKRSWPFASRAGLATHLAVAVGRISRRRNPPRANGGLRFANPPYGDTDATARASHPT
jgi:hypothetical protein